MRDLARFGETMRNGGRANGQQVIPASAMAEITGGGDEAHFAKAGYALLPEGIGGAVRAERSDGPHGSRSPPLYMRRAAQWHGRRAKSRASTSDSLHLFELNERSEWCELCNAPMPRAAQVAPDAAGGRGRRDRGRLLFAFFLLARQEKEGRRAGATTPLRNVV